MPFQTIVLLVGVLMIVAGCYCLIRTRNMLKIIIGLEVAIKAITMFFILGGYVNGVNGLAQAFVITIIVVEVVIAVVASGIAINLYKKYDSMDIRNLRKLKG